MKFAAGFVSCAVLLVGGTVVAQMSGSGANNGIIESGGGGGWTATATSALNMAGYAITNALGLTATGTVQAEQLTSTDDLTVTDAIGCASVTATGTVQAEQLTSTDDLTVTDAIGCAAVTASGTVQAEQLTSTDDITATDNVGCATLTASGNASVAGQYYDSALTTSTPSGTTQTVDWANGNVQKLDLEDASGNVTVTSNSETATAVYTLIIQQDGGGNNRTVTFPADWLFAGGTATYTLTVTATADAIDVVTCVAASASALYCTVSQDHK